LYIYIYTTAFYIIKQPVSYGSVSKLHWNPSVSYSNEGFKVPRFHLNNTNSNIETSIVDMLYELLSLAASIEGRRVEMRELLIAKSIEFINLEKTCKTSGQQRAIKGPSPVYRYIYS